MIILSRTKTHIDQVVNFLCEVVKMQLLDIARKILVSKSHAKYDTLSKLSDNLSTFARGTGVFRGPDIFFQLACRLLSRRSDARSVPCSEFAPRTTHAYPRAKRSTKGVRGDAIDAI